MPSKLFNEIHNIPSIPKVVQELIDDFGNDQSVADDISKKIQMDQSLSLKVMRLANSARYGAGRKINSIDSAIVMLGFDTLKTLVIASGVTAACKDVPGVDKKVFWRTSFSVANIAKMIAKLSDVNPEVAFTCGMLHNVGDMLLYIAHPEKMNRIDSMVESGANRSELQLNQFGYDYAIVGSELAKRWNFPPEIVDAITHQGSPDNSEFDQNLALIVNISAMLYKQYATQKSKEEMLSTFPSEKAQALKVDMLELFEKLVELFESEDDIESFLE